MSNELNQAKIAQITTGLLALIQSGANPVQALEAAFGKAATDKLIGDVYEALRAKAARA